MSKPYSLNKNDFLKGLVVAVAVAFVSAIHQTLSTQELNFSAWDWGFIVNAVIVAVGGYITKQYVSDESGKAFGKIG